MGYREGYDQDGNLTQEEELPNLSKEQMLEADNLYKTLQNFQHFKIYKENNNIKLENSDHDRSFSLLRSYLEALKIMVKNVNNYDQDYNKKFIAHYLLNNKDDINIFYDDIEKYIKYYIGGKPKAKSKKNKISQKKQSEYKEIFGKQMKIYKMPDSRKQYVRYKGELHSISDYKNLMKQKAAAKAKK